MESSFPLMSTPASQREALSDVELAARAAGGDEAAFEQIMRRHNRLMFRSARSILKSDAETEDALQEAYLRAWRSLAGFRADAKLSTWLVRIVINESLSRLRRRSAQVIPMEGRMDADDPTPQADPQDDPDHEPERIAMRGEVRRLMEKRIDTLARRLSHRVHAACRRELSVEEIAAVLEIPEATVRTALLPRPRAAARGPRARRRCGAGRRVFIRRPALRPHRRAGPRPSERRAGIGVGSLTAPPGQLVQSASAASASSTSAASMLSAGIRRRRCGRTGFTSTPG
jgi:RNA polymerase sigma-70 factor (ECF subfamily)